MHESRLSLIQHNNNHKTNNKKTRIVEGTSRTTSSAQIFASWGFQQEKQGRDGEHI